MDVLPLPVPTPHPVSSAAPRIAVQRLRPGARLPRYAHPGLYGDLAADVAAAEARVLAPGETAAVGTGLVLHLPAGVGVLVCDRSGLALRGLTTLAGVIDPGYRGELCVVLHNLGPAAISLAAGDRIAQIRVVPLLQAEFVEAAGDGGTGTARGTAGFGSTGA